MTMPTQQAIVAGPPGFATIRNVTPSNTPTGFTITCDTDQACQLQLNYWPSLNPSPVTAGPADAAATTHHVLSVTGLTTPGMSYQFQLVMAAADASGLTLRAYQGTVLIQGRYNRTTPQIPIRWNAFGGPPPAPAGGTGGQGGGTGNWNQYAWAQYNPKGTTYPTP